MSNETLKKFKWMISGFDLLNNELDKSSHSVHLPTKQTAAWLPGMANWLMAMHGMLTQDEIPNYDTIIASVPAVDGKVFALLLRELEENLGLNLVILLVDRTLREI